MHRRLEMEWSVLAPRVYGPSVLRQGSRPLPLMSVKLRNELKAGFGWEWKGMRHQRSGPEAKAETRLRGKCLDGCYRKRLHIEALWVTLGLSTSCSATFWQLFMFRATFSPSSNFFPLEQLVAFWAISRPKISEDYPSVVQRQYERFRRFTKFAEDFRGTSEDVSTFGSFCIKTLQNSSANMTSLISSRFFSVKEILVI